MWWLSILEIDSSVSSIRKKLSHHNHVHYNPSIKHASRCWAKRRWLHVLWDKPFPEVRTNRVESMKTLRWKVPWLNNEIHSSHIRDQKVMIGLTSPIWVPIGLAVLGGSIPVVGVMTRKRKKRIWNVQENTKKINIASSCKPPINTYAKWLKSNSFRWSWKSRSKMLLFTLRKFHLVCASSQPQTKYCVSCPEMRLALGRKLKNSMAV